MTVRALFFGLFFFALAAHAAERDVKQVFAVQPGCTLNVDLYGGAVTVVESDISEVQVAVHLEIGADTEEEAERVRQGLQLDIKSANNTVSVYARNPPQTRLRFFWNDKNQIGLTCKISVPRECNVELRTINGAITVGNLTGRVFARAETGAIFLRGIDGSVDARTDIGDVIVSHCTGSATLQTLRGTIRTGTLGGWSTLKNSMGDIEVLCASAGLTARSEVGDTTIGFPKNFTGDTDIRTSGGSIYAKIDPEANCVIKGSSVWGDVRSKLPLTVESGGDGKSKFTGRLNRGGPVLTLHASGGDVRITPGLTYFEEE